MHLGHVCTAVVKRHWENKPHLSTPTLHASTGEKRMVEEVLETCCHHIQDLGFQYRHTFNSPIKGMLVVYRKWEKLYGTKFISSEASLTWVELDTKLYYPISRSVQFLLVLFVDTFWYTVHNFKLIAITEEVPLGKKMKNPSNFLRLVTKGKAKH